MLTKCIFTQEAHSPTNIPTIPHHTLMHHRNSAPPEKKPLHPMHLTIPRPPPKRLPLPPKQAAKQAPKQHQTSIRHNRIHKPFLLRPRRDELAKPIPPHILVHRDAHEETAGDGLVAVHGVGAHDGRQRRDLDPRKGEADHDDGFPRPVLLVADRYDDVADVHDYDVRDHGGEAHFGLADAVVAPRGARGDPVGEGAGGEEADEGADEDGEVLEAC